MLVDFWTYTCINWLRTLPYVRAWAQRYQQGLVVIGVHTPEFPFERNVDNVRRAVQQMRIEYPIVIDNDYAIWRAFNNQYWPALYLVDGRGRVRQHQFGEGEYDTSERAIQRLLKEAGASGVSDGVVSVDGSGFEAAADWSSLRSPETYVGYDRTQNFASRDAARLDQRRTYRAPSRLALNQWSLAGDWTMGRTATVLNKAPGQILYRFHARDVHLVMGPSRPESPVPIPRDDRRPTTGRRSRSRRRRGWQRNGARAAAVSAGATAEADRRSNVRDRLPRCWRRDIRVHVRLTACHQEGRAGSPCRRLPRAGGVNVGIGGPSTLQSSVIRSAAVSVPLAASHGIEK